MICLAAFLETGKWNADTQIAGHIAVLPQVYGGLSAAARREWNGGAVDEELHPDDGSAAEREAEIKSN